MTKFKCFWRSMGAVKRGSDQRPKQAYKNGKRRIENSRQSCLRKRWIIGAWFCFLCHGSWMVYSA